MSKKELVDALNEYSVFNDEYDLEMKSVIF